MNNYTTAAHDKWIAGLAWIAMLGANLFTSFSAIKMVLESSMSRLVRMSSFLAGTTVPSAPMFSDSPLLWLSLILILATLALIFNTWHKFASFTTELMIAYARPESQLEKDNIFSNLLLFKSDLTPEKDQSNSDPEAASGSLISEVIRSLAYTWVMLLASSLLLSMPV